jgi:small subunit ribosomal protein S21
MILIDVQKYKSIEQALKVYKNKHNKIGTVKELRERQTFTKPSVTRRKEVLKAKYKEQLNNIYNKQ